MKKIKNFMERINWGTLVGKTCLAAVVVMGLLCASVYSRERHAEMQAKSQAEEQQLQIVEKNVKRLQLDENGFVKQENLVEAKAKTTKQPKFAILKMKNKYGLSNDDFWSYAILENQVRLQIFLYGSKHSKKEALQAVNVFIEFLKDVRDAEQFEDPDLYVRIDEQIYNERDLKAHIRKNGLMASKEYAAGMKELRKYFRDCRKAGQDFQSAVGNCKPTLTGEMEPELG